MERFARTVWLSLAASWCLFAVMFALLADMKAYDSDFFRFDKDVKLLGYPITKRWHVVVLVTFFFVNAFVNQWNGVVLDPIFGQLVYGDAPDARRTGVRRSRLFPLLAIYQLWGGAQWFFGLMGATSHVGFLLSSIAGSVSGGLLTRWMFLQPTIRPYIHHQPRAHNQPRADRERQHLLQAATLVPDWK